MTHPFELVRRAWDAYLFPLCKLNRIQFSAPWQAPRSTC